MDKGRGSPVNHIWINELPSSVLDDMRKQAVRKKRWLLHLKGPLQNDEFGGKRRNHNERVYNCQGLHRRPATTLQKRASDNESMADIIERMFKEMKEMTSLKKGQHYDSVDSAKVRDGAAILHAIKKHLMERDCKHTLKEIVQEGLEPTSLINDDAVSETSEGKQNGF